MPTILKKEEYELIDETITEIIRAGAVGTVVLKPYNIKRHIMELSWDEYTGRGEASLDMEMENRNFDNLALKDRQTISVPIAHSEFRLGWRMLEAARGDGRDLEMANVAEAAAVVLSKAEKTIFEGSTAFGIKGITNTASIESIAGADFSAAGNAYETFRKARDKMIENSITPPYEAFLNPAQYGEIDVLVSNTGISQRSLIEGTFVEKVHWSNNITADEGYVIGNSKQYMDRTTLGGVKKKFWKEEPDNDTTAILGQAYAIEIPRIRVAKAIVKMTGI